MPRLSLIMSTHNDAPYLAAAIDSLLQQTYTDFELILIDDASTDATPTILEGYTDPRLRRIRHEQNRGLTQSLIEGLSLAQGAFIGRMDADDIAVPLTRLADQVAFLEAHPEIGFLCGDMVYINTAGDFLPAGEAQPHYHQEGTHAYLAWRLLWLNPISHITILFRRELLRYGVYDPVFNMAEDYDLWARWIQVTTFYRAETVWAYRRILGTSISHSRLEKQLQLTLQISERELTRLLNVPPPKEALLTLFEVIHRPQNDQHDYQKATKLLGDVYRQYTQKNHLTQPEQQALQADLAQWLWRLSRRGRQQGRLIGLYPLWHLAWLAPSYFWSRQTLQEILASVTANKLP